MRWMFLALVIFSFGCTASEGCGDFVNEFADTYVEILKDAT